jgi:phytanoyl-CoA hydroxylase
MAYDGLKNDSFKGRKSDGPNGKWSLSRKEGKFSVQFESSIDIHNVEREELTHSYRKLMSFEEEDPLFEGLDAHPILSTYRNQLLGKDSILSQTMALSKPARFGIEKPWHQDNAYFTIAPLEDVMGIWMAIDDATLENGCMHFVPQPRYGGSVYKHIRNTDCEISKEDLALDQQIAVEVPAGGAIFFQGMAPHQTPPNLSSQGRRALQWHYRGANTNFLKQEEYDELFKTSDGRPASCSHT